MNSDSFIDKLIGVLEFVTAIGAAYYVYLYTGRSLLIAIIFWLCLQIMHSIHLMMTVNDDIHDSQQLYAALKKLNPIWFVINSLIMIGLSQYIKNTI